MDGPFSRQPDFADRGHPGGAAFGYPVVPSDLLALGEVAELLGEPESSILAACRSFPEHVPAIGSGRARRFPSPALDVLRLITDATAAGVPAPAIVHLLETHHAAARELATEIQESPAGIPLGYDEATLAFDMDELSGRLHHAIQAEVLPAMQAIASDLTNIQAAMDQMRAELRSVARADHFERLRVEVQNVAAAHETRSQAVDVAAELATMQADIRPALHNLDEVKLAIEGLREEMAALRWQLDQREQLGQVVAELAELRAQVSRLEAAAHPVDVGAPPMPEPMTDDESDAGTVADPAGDSTGTGETGDAAHQEATSPEPPAEPEVDTPSAIITELASRTPRRMGRTLFADEG